MRKRGQIQIMPFVYIFAIIVATFVLVLGFKYIHELISTGEKIEIGNIKTEIDKQTQFIYNLDPGSSDEFSYRSPLKLKMICFADSTSQPNPLELEKIFSREEDQIFFETFLDNGDNLFFIMEEPEENVHVNVDHLKSDENPFCVEPKNKRIIFILENKGQYVSPK